MMKIIKKHLSNEMTVNGTTIYQICDDAEVLDEEVIRSMDRPFHIQGGIAVLKGNLAPEGSVVKQSAVSEGMFQFTGTAKVFDSEAASIEAIDDFRSPRPGIAMNCSGVRGFGTRTLRLTATCAPFTVSAKAVRNPSVSAKVPLSSPGRPASMSNRSVCTGRCRSTG